MKIEIGFTKTFRQGWKGSTTDYVPSMDGYHDDAEQDMFVMEVESPPMDPTVVGEAFYKATNAPEEVIRGDRVASAIFDELMKRQAAGTIGKHRHSMDVGDTVQIDGGPKFVVAPFGFEQHTPGQVTCGPDAPYVGTA